MYENTVATSCSTAILEENTLDETYDDTSFQHLSETLLHSDRPNLGRSIAVSISFCHDVYTDFSDSARICEEEVVRKVHRSESTLGRLPMIRNGT